MWHIELKEQNGIFRQHWHQKANDVLMYFGPTLFGFESTNAPQIQIEIVESWKFRDGTGCSSEAQQPNGPELKTLKAPRKRPYSVTHLLICPSEISPWRPVQNVSSPCLGVCAKLTWRQPFCQLKRENQPPTENWTGKQRFQLFKIKLSVNRVYVTTKRPIFASSEWCEIIEERSEWKVVSEGSSAVTID